MDGSTLTLPNLPAHHEYFGKANHQAIYPTVRISQMYDILNKQTVDFQHSPFAVGERKLAAQHLQQTEEGDLVLYDRGYAASWLFALHNKSENNFCARMKSTFSNEIKAFSQSNFKDICVDVYHSDKSRHKCKELGLPLCAIKIRLIKFPLSSGEIEILATSLLDKKMYPSSLFKNLYHQRWFVEEDYKIMKSRMEFENCTGQSPQSVLQDIYAKVVTKNFAGMLYLESEKRIKSAKKIAGKEKQLNFTYILNKLKDNMVRLLLGDPLTTERRLRIIIDHCSQQTDILRPDRTSLRQMTKMPKLKHFFSYKRTT